MPRRTQIEAQLDAHGFVLVRQKKHRVYRHASGHTFVIPNTPSDRRWEKNSLSHLHRLLHKLDAGETPVLIPRSAPAPELPQPLLEVSPEPLAPPPELLPVPLTKQEQKKLRRWEKRELHRQREPCVADFRELPAVTLRDSGMRFSAFIAKPESM